MSPKWFAQQQRSGLYTATPRRQVGFARPQERIELDIDAPDDGGDVYAVSSDWVEVEEDDE